MPGTTEKYNKRELSVFREKIRLYSYTHIVSVALVPASKVYFAQCLEYMWNALRIHPTTLSSQLKMLSLSLSDSLSLRFRLRSLFPYRS